MTRKEALVELMKGNKIKVEDSIVYCESLDIYCPEFFIKGPDGKVEKLCAGLNKNKEPFSLAEEK